MRKIFIAVLVLVIVAFAATAFAGGHGKGGHKQGGVLKMSAEGWQEQAQTSGTQNQSLFFKQGAIPGSPCGSGKGLGQTYTGTQFQYGTGNYQQQTFYGEMMYVK